MPRKSLTRLVLDRLSMNQLRDAADFFDVARARGADETAARIARRLGANLERLVSPAGPFTIEFWSNWIVEELGALPQHGWPDLRAEIGWALALPEEDRRRFKLLREFTVGMVRESPEATHVAALLLRTPPSKLLRQLARHHGNTLIETVLDELVDKLLPRHGAPHQERSPAPATPSNSSSTAPRRAPPPSRAPVTNWKRPKKGALLRHWVVDEYVGEGGYGCVFRGHDTRWPKHRLVLKFPKDSEGADSLANEYDKALPLQHSNVCKYIARETSAEYGTFLVMLDAGESVARVFADGASAGAAIEVAHQAAEALDYLHDRDIVHMDVNPGNLLVDDAGLVRITDFGISATLMKALGTDAYVTRIGTAVRGHHPIYSAPEVRAGRPAAASDQYSLALVLCAMIHGVAKFTEEDVRRFSELSPASNAALGRALSRNRSDRFPSCRAFADAFAA